MSCCRMIGGSVLILELRYLYVLAAGLNSINVLAINDPGKSQLIQSYNFTTPANNDGIPTVFPHVLGLATYVMSSYA